MSLVPPSRGQLVGDQGLDKAKLKEKAEQEADSELFFLLLESSFLIISQLYVESDFIYSLLKLSKFGILDDFNISC